MNSGKNKVLFYTSDHLLVGAPIGYYRQTTKSPPRVSLSLSLSSSSQPQLPSSLSSLLLHCCYTIGRVRCCHTAWLVPSYSSSLFIQGNFFSLPPLPLYLLYRTLIATSSTTLTMSSTAAATPEKAPDDSSKLKTFLSILRKYALPSNSTVTVSTYYSIHAIFQPGRYILIR